ncbi:MAG: DUF3320 domain-containing protein [Planctomycetes bacterium]|nr:DUF3320 domain-containing protein [Planctomycetota bacterium]
MTRPALEIAVRHAPQLCYAMQQSAVPWLFGITLTNTTAAPLADLHLRVELLPGPLAAHDELLAAIPAGGTFELGRLDPRLDVQALANLFERQRAELRVTVTRGEQGLATASSDLDVLAWNEWPGLGVAPSLLAAFVLPNHPVLAGLLRAVGERLQQTTGNSALDGYQAQDPQRALAIFAAVHESLRALRCTYVNPPPSFEKRGQKVRTPEQVLGDRLGTCLDLALVYAAVLEHAGLHPLVVLQKDHAFVGAWLVPGSTPEPWLGLGVELQKRAELGALAFCECTLACGAASQPFALASAAALRRLQDEAAFAGALDVAAARRAGMMPLPGRTSVYAAMPEPPAGVPATASAPAAAAGTAPAPAPAPEPAPRAPEPPKDRLEHWKGKLLDLTLWNRLLHFVETKKTVRLCAHDLAALENRLQQGARLRIHARPAVGQGSGDPRDLALQQQRTGQDVMAGLLAEELRAGRLRAEHDADELDARLVEIFRHARTSLEETGANTLYLAVGFLEWYETMQSNKARRAPLLLLPLTVERISVQEGFRFLLDDGEPRLNQTLLQLLQRDFDVRLPLGDTVPEDEHGIDVAAVLDAFRQAVVGLPRWRVEARACIGFFSFSKYLMWLDLAARDELLQSPVLRHLVEKPGAAFAQDVPEVARERLDELDPAEVFCPKDTDSSQLAAVLAGAAGRTFVLEGPPGTGKSQTITNLVAQALANDRSVLFVAEKRAALEVVQKRLTEVGLGAFCLELHSSKSGPKAVLEQLARPLDLGARRAPAAWARVAADLQHERRELNGYVSALHRVREHGVSVFSAIAQLIELREAVRLPMPDLLRNGPAGVAAARAAVDDLAAAAAPLPVPEQAPWWGVRARDYSPALLRAVEPAAERLLQTAAALQRAVAAAGAAFGLAGAFGPGPSRTQIEKLGELAALFTAPSPPPASLLRAADGGAGDAALAQLLATGKKRDLLWAPLAGRWRRELLGLDLDRLLPAWRRAAESFVLLRWWRLRGPRAELLPAAAGGGLGTVREVLGDLEQALRVRAEERALLAATTAAAAFGPAWRAGLADWAQLDGWLSWVRDARRLCLELVPGSLRPEPAVVEAIAARLDGLHAGAADLGRLLGALRLAADEHGASLRAVAAPLALDAQQAFGAPDAPGHLAAVGRRAAAWRAALPALRDHCAYAAAAARAAAAGAGPLVAAHARGALSTEQLAPSFLRTFLESWLDTVHRAEPKLGAFRGLDHERAIARFAELDRQAIRLAAEVVVARLAAKLPQLRDTAVASSELGVLERELKKQRRHKPVRKLFAEIPGLLSVLAPCVLMSPRSIAQFLGRGGSHFDLVVFDEASQIPMWDAVGAIGRGRSLVVVGDSRQLPPTSFFQRLEQGDEPPPDDVPEDLESVLDECGAAGLPRLHLDWHYRSRHESLIAFSNRHYYQNRLLTFPAPERETPGLGVRSVLVAGVYDRAGSRTNRLEAEALVAEVVARLRDPARNRHSIGIVFFSQGQQVLVEDLLDAARAQHAELEPFFTTVPEPVFVKNLENVQGDERDAILFSICYGPDAAGKVYENYGPLNLQGGERRLNVAVTRARRELVVFTSLRADQVAARSAALGARHLRTFLDYAQRGEVALLAAAAADPRGEVESPFEAAVCAALVQRGHEVHPQVGCSGYRIDLAVVDPEAPGRYLLGIECDGATYHAAATARDRDRLRAAVLRGLGWRLHRVWSTDFWQDPAGEVARIEAAIAAAVAAAGEPPRMAAVAEPAPAPATPAPAVAPAAPAAPEPAPAAARDPTGPHPFTAAALPKAGTPEAFAAAAATAKLREQALAVLAAEAPVVFDRLARTIAAAWAVPRLTERVRERVRGALPAGAVEVDGALWAAGADVAAFVGFRVPAEGGEAERPAEELPMVEVGNAMAWLLRQHHALPADDLAREAARCFGITRLGSVVRGVMQRGLVRLLEAGRGVRDGETVRLP